MWIVFALGAAVGLVLGNKTLRTKLGQLLQSIISKKKSSGSPDIRVVPTGERLVCLMSHGGAWSVDDLMDKTGLPRQTVLSELERSKLFRRVGHYWVYAENE